MKIAYITEFDVKNSDKSTWQKNQLGHWGCCYYIAKYLEDEDTTLDYFSPLKQKNDLLPKIKRRLYQKFTDKLYHFWADPIFNKDYAAQIAAKLSTLESDIVFSPDLNFVAYLKCDRPIVIWVDTIYAGLINSYPDYTNLCQETLQHLKEMDKLALSKCSLAIFSSEWTAKTAIENYQIDSAKIKIVPFGANIECSRNIDEIEKLIESRPKNICKLMFIGVDWIRKGGNITLEVAKELNRLGLNTELTIVGCQPVTEEALPSFVKVLGFINKSDRKESDRLNKLLSESHFFILPSQAECYGHVFCEANSFGVPCVATNVGGIPTIIRDGANGKTFSLDANISEYCNYILPLMSNYGEYEKLALSSFNEYQTRLNWSVACGEVKKLLRELI